MDNDEFIRPPGTYYDILPHPRDIERTVEVAMVQDHRFAFFYWLKWRNTRFEAQPPPTLVSLDWHEDLTEPCDVECDLLRELDQADYRKVALFAWDQLHPHNDGHILAATYLNLIGDVHVLQKQEEASSYVYVDANDGEHWIHTYESLDALLIALAAAQPTSIFFDIDLDYFTESEAACGGEDVELVSEAEIAELLNVDGPLMCYVLPRIAGMTIATEPEFCGGLENSNSLCDTVIKALFSPSLLTTRANWRSS